MIGRPLRQDRPKTATVTSRKFTPIVSSQDGRKGSRRVFDGTKLRFHLTIEHDLDTSLDGEQDDMR